MLFLVSAGAFYAMWATAVRRPEHHGEVAFFYLFSLWAIIPAASFLLAAILVRQERFGGWRFLVQGVAFLSPVVSAIALLRML